MGSDTACHAVRLRPGLFQSTLPGWGATPLRDVLADFVTISIHAPRMGSDLVEVGDASHVGISIHAPRMGSDSPDRNPRSGTPKFQSTLPGWGATGCSFPEWPKTVDFNPRSPDGERRAPEVLRSVHVHISIHAPRMGSDDLADLILDTISRISIHAPRMGSDRGGSGRHRGDGISIHAPRMGSDVSFALVTSAAKLFQSTLPGWGATMGASTGVSRDLFQSTLPGWGATLRIGQRGRPARISIHAPRMGSDHFKDGGHYFLVLFQSALPGWGATDARMDRATGRDFNPRSPDGERLSGG